MKNIWFVKGGIAYELMWHISYFTQHRGHMLLLCLSRQKFKAAICATWPTYKILHGIPTHTQKYTHIYRGLRNRKKKKLFKWWLIYSAISMRENGPAVWGYIVLSKLFTNVNILCIYCAYVRARRIYDVHLHLWKFKNIKANKLKLQPCVNVHALQMLIF